MTSVKIFIYLNARVLINTYRTQRGERELEGILNKSEVLQRNFESLVNVTIL